MAGQLERVGISALDNGWQTIAELAEDDRGASGASFELPELNHARDMAQKGEFDVLVVLGDFTASVVNLRRRLLKNN